MRQIFLLIFILIFCFLKSPAQDEVLTNANVVEMAKAGLEKQLILKKISATPSNFEISTNALIELKKAGVEAEIIALMMEKAVAKKETLAAEIEKQVGDDNPKNYSESTPTGGDFGALDKIIPTPKEALLRAKSVAIVKSSLHPSRQALEKELMKRRAWQNYNLSIVRYREEADIYIEIGYVSLSWITHRYVFRIYDRRSGVIITAGETTSWGSLAGNLAREITEKMEKVGTK